VKLFVPQVRPGPAVASPAPRRASSFDSGTMSWGMYVVPDDPIRNTPEKAEKYYKVVWAMMDQEKVDNLNRTT
jgi:hypothetical protein